MKMKHKLLVLLHELHISEKGDHISSIAGTRLHLKDHRITEAFPDLIEWKNKNTFEKQTIKYALDLVTDGLVERKEMEIWMTLEGFRKAKEFKHPLLTFGKKYWMWIAGTAIAIIALILK
jgi:hypothetical protein